MNPVTTLENSILNAAEVVARTELSAMAKGLLLLTNGECLQYVDRNLFVFEITSLNMKCR